MGVSRATRETCVEAKGVEEWLFSVFLLSRVVPQHYDKQTAKPNPCAKEDDSTDNVGKGCSG